MTRKLTFRDLRHTLDDRHACNLASDDVALVLDTLGKHATQAAEVGLVQDFLVRLGFIETDTIGFFRYDLPTPVRDGDAVITAYEVSFRGGYAHIRYTGSFAYHDIGWQMQLIKALHALIPFGCDIECRVAGEVRVLEAR